MRDNDFRLVTLGRLALCGPAGEEDPELNTRRRKVAVLAVLALARHPVSRDVLTEMFWGDQDDVRARHSLSDALSHLRRVMGRDVIAASRAQAALTPNAPLTVDALEFERAVAARDFARAIGLYSGPFLDGVHIGASNTFDRWVAGERTRLESLLQQACREECTALARARRWEECAAVAARWLDAAPLSVDAALFLLNALKAPATREADQRALLAYDGLRARLASDYDLLPERPVAELAEAIVARLEAGAVPAGTATRDELPSSGAGLAPPAQAREAPPIAVRRRPRRAIVAALAVALLAVAMIARAVARSPDDLPPGAAAVVAVLPFTVHGAPELEFLRSGMVDLLSTNLDGAGGFRSVDARAVLALAPPDAGASPDPARQRETATRLGAGSFVTGTVVRSGDAVRIDAALYGVARGRSPIARASASGAADELFALVDRLTAQLLVGRVPAAGGRLTRIAAMTTHSIPALKAYLEGEAHWRAVRLPEAIESFERAVMLDSTFALAWYRLAVASSWEARVDLARDAIERARRHGATLSEHDRRLVDAYHAIVQHDGEEVERRYRSIVADYPSDLEAWGGLGEMWFHGNPVRGRSFTESRQAWEHILRLEPTNMGAAWHLAQVAAREGRRAELDSLVTRIQSSSSGGAELSLRAIHATALGDSTEVAALIPELRAADDYTLIITVWRVALFSTDIESVVRYAALLTEPRRPREVRAVGHVLLAHLELAGGRWRGALAQLSELETIHPSWAIEYRALLAASPFLDLPAAELAKIRDAVATWNAQPGTSVTSGAALWVNAHAELHPQLRTYLVGVLSARIRDRARADQARDELARRQGDSDADKLARAQARGIEAEWKRGEDDVRGALGALERAPFQVDFGSGRVSAFHALGRERFLRAELLHSLERHDEALGWYRGLGEIFPYDIIYVAPSHLRQAEILVQDNRRAEAAEHYERFLELWSNADPELAATVSDARRRLAALH